MGHASFRGRFRASRWGWTTVAATVVSMMGYALQTILDWVPEPAAVGEVVFWGMFAGSAAVALLVGVVAIAQGRKRVDDTLRFGILGVLWFALAQSIQALWD